MAMDFNEFLSNYHITLNEQQKIAVQAIDKPTLLLAVPGSGKTTVIVARIGYMLSCCNIEPENILTVTYSVAATKDMKQRYISAFCDDVADRLQFRTIHGLCCLIINRYEKLTGKTAFSLMDSDSEVTRIIRNIFTQVSSAYATENNIRDILSKITYARNMMLSDEEVKKIEVNDVDFFEVYDKYRSYKTENKLMDYDDQLEFAYKILKGNSGVLEIFQDKYKYINVDEAQDTSKIQHKIIQLLASKHNNIFMVGDEDQSIYGFRAAYPKALLEFKNTYPNAQVLLMEQNYRSTKEIVEKSNDFIKRNKNRFDKNMFTKNEKGKKVKHTVLEDYHQQYRYLLEIAKKPQIQTAVLYRNNECAIPLIDLLERNRVKFRVRENSALFFTHYVTTDMVNILKFALDRRNVELFMSIYYKMGFCMNKRTAEQAVKLLPKFPNSDLMSIVIDQKLYDERSYTKLLSIRMKLSELLEKDSYRALNFIINEIGYGDYLKSRNADMSKVNLLLALAVQTPDIKKFLQRLDYLHEYIRNGSGSTESDFILSTIHSSKGLEYEKVILIDAKDGVLPGFTNWELRRDFSDEELETLEEDRRLFYVAATRAKTYLEIISAKRDYMKPLVTTPAFVRHFMNDPALKPISERTTISAKSISGVTSSADFDKMNSVLTVNTAVVHKFFGKGVISAKTDKLITVKCFKDDTERSFDLKSCIKNKLLKLDEE